MKRGYLFGHGNEHVSRAWSARRRGIDGQARSWLEYEEERGRAQARRRCGCAQGAAGEVVEQGQRPESSGQATCQANECEQSSEPQGRHPGERHAKPHQSGRAQRQ